MFNIQPAIKDRRSIHRYKPREIAWSLVEKVLEAATWAPSAHNAQPWRFVVISDPEIKQRLAAAMAEEWDKDLTENGMSREGRESLTQASVRQFTQPPIVIIACLTMGDMDAYPDERRRKAEFTMAVQSVAASVQNLLLAAHAEGLGTCWFCAPLFCPDVVRRVLEIPEDVAPQALITLGYADEQPKKPFRRPMKSIVYQNRWGCDE